MNVLLRLGNVSDSSFQLLALQWCETEASASRLQRRNYLGQVVRDDDESRVVRVLLNDYKTNVKIGELQLQKGKILNETLSQLRR